MTLVCITQCFPETNTYLTFSGSISVTNCKSYCFYHSLSSIDLIVVEILKNQSFLLTHSFWSSQSHDTQNHLIFFYWLQQVNIESSSPHVRHTVVNYHSQGVTSKWLIGIIFLYQNLGPVFANPVIHLKVESRAPLTIDPPVSLVLCQLTSHPLPSAPLHRSYAQLNCHYFLFPINRGQNESVSVSYWTEIYSIHTYMHTSTLKDGVMLHQRGQLVVKIRGTRGCNAHINSLCDIHTWANATCTRVHTPIYFSILSSSSWCSIARLIPCISVSEGDTHSKPVCVCSCICHYAYYLKRIAWK